MSKQKQVFDLGHSIARVGECGWLTVVSPADASSGFYEPAQTIILTRKDGIQALRDACDLALDNSQEI